MKITLDTNFLVSATQWNYSVCFKLLAKFIMNNSELFVTWDILNEFSEVLMRDFEYNKEEAENIINKVVGFVQIIETSSKIEVIKEDLDDNKILECALDSKSEYIISYDKHLLNLKEFSGIKIITPEEMNKLLR